MKKGLRGARIEDITAACGLSKGAFYLHAASKEALFGEVVGEFTAAMNELIERRMKQMERFFAEHGPLEARDVAERSERYELLVEMNTEADLGTLELMWAYRDVVHVLLRGSQGTEFESLMWGMVDREVTRVAQEFQRLQADQREPRGRAPYRHRLAHRRHLRAAGAADEPDGAEAGPGGLGPLHPPAHPRGQPAPGQLRPGRAQEEDFPAPAPGPRTLSYP